MPFSSAPNEASDLVAVFRHKFESVFDMHGVKTGSPEDLAEFIEKLRNDRYFAMDFWDIAQSADRLGKVSRAEVRDMVVECVAGPGVDTGPEAQQVKELQSEFDEKLVEKIPAVEHLQNNETVQGPVQNQESKIDEDTGISSGAPSPERAFGLDRPAYTVGSDEELQERPGAFPYSRSRQMDDALARLEINSNALKLQLEDIDSRMSRIEPHLEDLSSRVAIPPSRDSTDDGVREPEIEVPHVELPQATVAAAEEERVPRERRGTPPPVIRPDGSGRILVVAPVLLLLLLAALMGWMWRLEYQSRHRAQNAGNSVGPIAGNAVPNMAAESRATASPSEIAPVKVDTTLSNVNLPTSAGSRSTKADAAVPEGRSRKSVSSFDGKSIENDTGVRERPRQLNSPKSSATGEVVVDDADSKIVVTNAPDARSERSAEEDAGNGAPRLERRSERTATGSEEMSRGISVSFGVMATHLIESKPPRYPRLAKLTHVQGAVVLQVFISKEGTVDHVDAVKGNRLLRGAAKNAVKEWRYRPYLLNGVPVEVATIVTVNFRLGKDDES